MDILPPDADEKESKIRLDELESLTSTYGGMVIIKVIQKKAMPDYQMYVGKGKVDEIFEIAKENKVKLIVVNNILKPHQLYNLNEKFRKINAEVWDRVEMILKIFEKHAESAEAKLQVELASIKHMGPRIYGIGKELSQQRGNIGMRSGQGETNIELMKRHLRALELKIKEKLEHLNLIKEGHRLRRRRNNLKTVALIGYTNTGKSTLLNSLTKKGALAANQLFSTLDTRVGKLYIPNEDPCQPGREILISDTIGFIRDLPPTLIQAFKSTLAETVESDLILHVIDINDIEIDKKIEVVDEILHQLKIGDKPQIYVFNKVDLIDYKKIEKKKGPPKIFQGVGLMKAGEDTAARLGWQESANCFKKGYEKKYHKNLLKKYKKFNPVFVSAEEKLNLDELIKVIAEKTK